MFREDGGPVRQGWRGERGAALVFALLAMTLLTVLGGALVAATVTETTIAARHRDGTVAFYAAESALAHTLRALDREADWGMMVNGDAWSRYLEGPLADLIGGAAPPHAVTVWLRDAGGGTLGVRARAEHGGRARVVEATVARRDGSIRVLSWNDGR